MIHVFSSFYNGCVADKFETKKFQITLMSHALNLIDTINYNESSAITTRASLLPLVRGWNGAGKGTDTFSHGLKNDRFT